MPSFDITSEINNVNFTNAIDVTKRQIDNRYDFKNTSANVEYHEKDSLITIFGDTEFQINQIKDILLPALEKKEPEDKEKKKGH